MLELFQDLPWVDVKLTRGRYLFHQGDDIHHLYLITAGEILLFRRNRQGERLVLQRGTHGSLLAEASLFSERYHCDAAAEQESTMRRFNRKEVTVRFEEDIVFSRSWAIHLASEIRKSRLQTEILSQRTVAKRLDLWLLQNRVFPAKGNWRNLASEIGVSPEALYREIEKRRVG